jgi:hypothetical protein
MQESSHFWLSPAPHDGPRREVSIMTVTACPATIVAAPIEDVWALLADTAAYLTWWDAQTDRIVPTGPTAPG